MTKNKKYIIIAFFGLMFAFFCVDMSSIVFLNDMPDNINIEVFEETNDENIQFTGIDISELEVSTTKNLGDTEPGPTPVIIPIVPNFKIKIVKARDAFEELLWLGTPPEPLTPEEINFYNEHINRFYDYGDIVKWAYVQDVAYSLGCYAINYYLSTHKYSAKICDLFKPGTAGMFISLNTIGMFWDMFKLSEIPEEKKKEIDKELRRIILKQALYNYYYNKRIK